MDGLNGWTEWMDRMDGQNGWIEWMNRMDDWLNETAHLVKITGK